MIPTQCHVTHKQTPSKEDAIFISAGNRETFASYATEKLANEFDLLIFFYGDDEVKEKTLFEKSTFFAKGSGTKFNALKQLFFNHLDVFDQYKTIWVCDDDIIWQEDDIHLIPNIIKVFNVKVASPSFSLKGKISHPITITANGSHLFRYVSFLEMTAPWFCKNALKEYLLAYDGSLDGWGNDWWFLQVFGASERKAVAAIVDRAIAINPLDKNKIGAHREIDLTTPESTRIQQWENAKKIHALKEWEQANLYLVQFAPPTVFKYAKTSTQPTSTNT